MPKRRPTSINQTMTEDGELTPLVHAYQQVQILNQEFTAVVDSEVDKHCQVVFYHDGKLGLKIDNNAWAAKFRFLQPQLLSTLQDSASFHKLIEIKIL